VQDESTWYGLSAAHSKAKNSHSIKMQKGIKKLGGESLAPASGQMIGVVLKFPERNLS
jgi:hypothetical protein